MNTNFLVFLLIFHTFDFYFDLGVMLNTYLNGCDQPTYLNVRFNLSYNNLDMGVTANNAPDFWDKKFKVDGDQGNYKVCLCPRCRLQHHQYYSCASFLPSASIFAQFTPV